MSSIASGTLGRTTPSRLTISGRDLVRARICTGDAVANLLVEQDLLHRAPEIDVAGEVVGLHIVERRVVVVGPERAEQDDVVAGRLLDIVRRIALRVFVGDDQRHGREQPLLQLRLDIERADRIGVLRLQQRGDAVERAGGQDVQRLLVEAARLVLRQIVREVGRFDDQRVAVDQRRQRIGHPVPIGTAGADRDGDRQDLGFGKIVLHEGQHRADAVILVEQAVLLDPVAGLEKPANGIDVGRYLALDRLEAAPGRRERLVRLAEMVRRQDDDALVGLAGRGPEPQRDQPVGQQDDAAP